jgi:Fe-S oxidoreductase
MALEDYIAEAERCSQCSYCKWIPMDQMKSLKYSRGCPSIAYNNFNSYSARGRYAVSLALVRGDITYSEKLKHIAYQCCTCGSCDVSCKVCRYNLEPLEMIQELKARLVSDHQTLPQYEALINILRKENNLVSKPKNERGNWADGLNLKPANNGLTEVLFHAGCRYSFDKSLWPKARAAVTLFKNAGVDFGVLGGAEMCCGGRAYDMGYREDFNRCARNNIETWKTLGVKTIVTSCANCYHAFKRLYPVLGYQFEVLHTAEYLDRLIKASKIKFTRKVSLKVTYHDPCHLGRRGEPYIPWEGKEKKIKKQIIVYDPPKPRYNGAWGVYDPPRNVLKSIPGLQLVEMERIREYAWCCGSGAGVKEAYPDFSNWTATERIEEAESTGAEAIVSACSGCERNFLDAIQASGKKMQVFDLADLAQAAL